MLEWLRPPRTGRPADTLRWVRRLHLVIAPVGLLLAALLIARHESWWWLPLSTTVMSVLGMATMGPSIRRAEAHGPLDPATAPERRRRALRLTAVFFGVFAVASVALFWLLLGRGAAIGLAIMWLIGGPLGLWLASRWIPG